MKTVKRILFILISSFLLTGVTDVNFERTSDEDNKKSQTINDEEIIYYLNKKPMKVKEEESPKEIFRELGELAATYIRESKSEEIKNVAPEPPSPTFKWTIASTLAVLILSIILCFCLGFIGFTVYHFL